MFSNASARYMKLTPSQKRLWGVGAAVIGFGSLVKFGYFYLSRTMIIDNLAKSDKEARSYLKESQEFARWSAKDREEKLIKLTDEQREQMQNYLLLLKRSDANKEVYRCEELDMERK
mmetsp:Transcript_24019/g.36605  ORF Transcript_24019/g.36605 Transcript_24019/m.36605 type:complete len:117 (+) Transcript_24019:95-445(+)